MVNFTHLSIADNIVSHYTLMKKKFKLDFDKNSNEYFA